MASLGLTDEDLVELLPLENSTSVVWKFFGFPSCDGKMMESDKKKRKRVFCKLCKRDYYYVGNTTNLWQHLEEGHINEFCQAKEESKRDNKSNLSSDKNNLHPLRNESSSQPTLNEVMSRK